jgi:hypothetical protein
MITSAYDIPSDGYWQRLGATIWQYPLITVFATSKAAADQIAGPDALDGVAFFHLALDSAEAQHRAGTWGMQ